MVCLGGVRADRGDGGGSAAFGFVDDGPVLPKDNGVSAHVSLWLRPEAGR
jgi:hypothetical protein